MSSYVSSHADSRQLETKALLPTNIDNFPITALSYMYRSLSEASTPPVVWQKRQSFARVAG
jgi:hypothetical protein